MDSRSSEPDSNIIRERCAVNAPFLALASMCLVLFGPLPFGRSLAETRRSAEEQSLRVEMKNVFVPLSVVLPVSFQADVFAASTNRSMIAVQLRRLADNAEVLAKHAQSRDHGFQFVARTLGRDASDVSRLFDGGFYEEARYTLHNMTDACIACHAAAPETKRAPRTPEFFAAIDLKGMTPLERAHYLVVARDFGDALTTYEEFFRSTPDTVTGQFLMRPMIDYLRICLHVKNDGLRPARLFDEVSGRPGTPRHVGEQLQRWSTSLRRAHDKSRSMPNDQLEIARMSLREGRERQEFPQDRDGLIEIILANAQAGRVLQRTGDSGPESAEAYYILAVTESLLGRQFWVSREEIYLEWAIRLRPSADFAPKAYTRLEDIVIQASKTPVGVIVPDVAVRVLKELRGLIEAAKLQRT